MNIFRTLILITLLIPHFASSQATNSSFRIGRLKYSGGGDWYNDPSAEVNLLRFVQQHTLLDVDPKYEFVEIASEKLYTYPMIFLTGHGTIKFSELDAERLRIYLEQGGFLYADDDYGMDKSFRAEIKKVFPENELVELPYSFGVFHSHFDFSAGAPKTHKHDDKPPQSFGIFHNGRLVVLYTYESNPSDGWADAQVHNDPEEKREEALKFGTNIIVWLTTH
jgi:hypothetical protein